MVPESLSDRSDLQGGVHIAVHFSRQKKATERSVLKAGEEISNSQPVPATAHRDQEWGRYPDRYPGPSEQIDTGLPHYLNTQCFYTALTCSLLPRRLLTIWHLSTEKNSSDTRTASILRGVTVNLQIIKLGQCKDPCRMHALDQHPKSTKSSAYGGFPPSPLVVLRLLKIRPLTMYNGV